MSSISLTNTRRMHRRSPSHHPAAFPGITILLGIIVATQTAHGQQANTPRLETDRPYVAIPPAIVPAGYLQMEAGIALEQDASGARTERIRHRAITYPLLLGRLGLLPGIELQVGAEYLDETNTNIMGVEVERRLGLRRVTAGAKMRIMEENGPIPESAFLLKLELPMGHEGLHPTFTQPGFLLSLRNTIGDDLKLTYALGGTWDGASGAARALYAGALSARFIPNAIAFVELHGGLASSEHPAHSLGTGVIYQVGRSIQLDLAGSKALNNAATDSHLSIGISLRLPRFPAWIVD